jgi:hypothetical protein
MPLKPIIDSIDDLPEAVRPFYVKDDDGGHFRLDVAGMVPKAKVDEFRENNTRLLKTVDELTKKFEGVDLDEYETLKKSKTKKPTKEGDDGDIEAKIEAAVADRIGKMKKAHGDEIKNWETKYTTTRTRMERELIDRALATAAAQAGCVETGVDDIVMRGRTVFKLDENDRVLPMSEDGKIMYGADGEPIGIKEWMQTLAQKAPHLFKQSSGAGADNRGTKGGGPTVRSKADLATPGAKSKFIEEHGLDAFMALPMRAA